MSSSIRLTRAIAAASLIFAAFTAAATSASAGEVKPAGAGAVTRGSNGLVAYASTKSDAEMSADSEIYTVSGPGATPVQLTHNHASDESPAFSPDGTKIAFISNRAEDDSTESGTDLWVMNADGSGARKVTLWNTSFVSDPTWSPDGQRIAFSLATTEGGIGDIDVIQSDSDSSSTGIDEPTTDYAPSATSPSWSPDGTHIVFISGQSGTDTDVVSMDYSVATPTFQTFPSGGHGDSYNPTYSVDSSRVFWDSDQDIVDEGGNTHTIDRVSSARSDGTDGVNVVPTASEYVSVSPDGTKIIYDDGTAGSPSGIYTLAVDANGRAVSGATPTLYVADPNAWGATWAKTPVLCQGRYATIVGTAGANYLIGTSGDDVIAGLGGNDTIRGGAGKDVICGGAGNDVLYGGYNRDLLYGEDGDDHLIGDDFAGAGSGDDYLVGGSGNDHLAGKDGDDRLVGGAGNDDLDGGLGADIFVGGTGTDTANYRNANHSKRITLDNKANDGSNGDGSSTDNVRTDVENVTGSEFNDTIIGDSYGNRLFGAGGNDVVSGMGGNDTVIGGAGRDSLLGGNGDDYLVARDNEVDAKIDGGAGTDKATRDTSDPSPISVP